MISIIEYLIQCDYAYHNGLEPLVSDYEYDVMKTKAKEDNPNDLYFSSIGASIDGDGDEVDLPHILGSLEKKKYDGSMNQWVQDTGVIEIVAGDKLDGCTIYAKYMDGKLIQATTRGDGYVGRDITDKAKIFCPPCNETGIVELKGEVLAIPNVARSLKDNKGKYYKKSRTFVAGELNRPEIKHSEHLSVVFYHVLNSEFATYEDHLSYIKEIGLPVVEHTIFKVEHLDNVEDTLAGLYKERKELSIWDLDGLVIIDNLDGNHTDEFYPTNACAFKVNENATPATVRDVILEIKRSGKLQPVVYIEPVEISGSTVTKATGFNWAFIRDNNIGKGTKIGIVLSGEIIPYISDVYGMGEDFVIITHCPDCNSRLVQTETGVDLICDNRECSGRMLYRLENFLLSNGVEEITATTLKSLDIKNFEELLTLDEFDISGREGFGASRASTIINQIKKVYNTSPANLLKSFGITGVGKTMSAELFLHFDSFEDLFSATIDTFKSIPGIGDKMAERLYTELPECKGLYDMLVGFGLSFKKSGDSLKGLKVVLTGKSELKRNDIVRMVEEQGGMVKGMSKSVDILATNSPDSRTSKMKKAREYGIRIIGYDELYDILGVTV